MRQKSSLGIASRPSRLYAAAPKFGSVRFPEGGGNLDTLILKFPANTSTLKSSKVYVLPDSGTTFMKWTALTLSSDHRPLVACSLRFQWRSCENSQQGAIGNSCQLSYFVFSIWIVLGPAWQLRLAVFATHRLLSFATINCQPTIIKQTHIQRTLYNDNRSADNK